MIAAGSPRARSASTTTNAVMPKPMTMRRQHQRLRQRVGVAAAPARDDAAARRPCSRPMREDEQVHGIGQEREAEHHREGACAQQQIDARWPSSTPMAVASSSSMVRPLARSRRAAGPSCVEDQQHRAHHGEVDAQVEEHRGRELQIADAAADATWPMRAGEERLAEHPAAESGRARDRRPAADAPR